MSNFLNKTAFKPFDNGLTEREKAEFLCSRAYCDMLSNLMYSITLENEKVILLPPFGDDLAFTDGKAVYICTVHKDYIHYGIDAITMNNIALAIHEPFHKKYSDFQYLKRLMSSQIPHLSLRKWLLNAICDGRIERIGCLEYQGYAPYIVEFRKKFYAHATSNTSPNAPKEQSQFQDLLSNILLFATCGLPKFPLEDEYKEAFEKCRPLIIKGRRSDSTVECDGFVEQIFNILLPLLPPQFETPEIPNGMTEWSSGGSGSGRRTKKVSTGGADFMHYDEDDNDDSDDNDTDDTNTSNQQGSGNGNSGKKKQKSSVSSSGSSNKSNSSSDSSKNGNSSGSEGDEQSNKDKNKAKNGNGASNDGKDDKTDASGNANGNANGNDTDSQKDGITSSESSSTETSSKHQKHDIRNDGEFDDDGKDTVSGMNDNQFSDMLRKTIEGIVPAFEKEKRDNQSDAQRNAELESTGRGNGYNVTTVRPSVENRNKYNEIVSKVAPISTRLAHEMKKVIHYNQDEVRRGLTRGKIDPSGLTRLHNGRCFFKHIEKSDESDLFVSILLDCSGSMSGPKLVSMVTQTTIILEACKQLKIPISIIGFYGSGARTSIVHYYDYKHQNPLNRSNVVKMFASGCTPLSEAIEYHRNYLKKVRHQDKLCFIITDGEPDSNSAAVRSFNSLKKEALSFGIAIDNGIEQLKSIFGNNFIDGRDLSRLPVEICTIIRKNILKS